MINERYLKFLALQECVKILLADVDITSLNKGTVEYNEKSYDLIKISDEMSGLIDEILSDYEVNVDENAEKSE